MTTKEAIDHLVKSLNEDESYRYAWQANIAVQFQDAMREHGEHKGIHEISNIAADRFLKMLCYVNSDEKSDI